MDSIPRSSSASPRVAALSDLKHEADELQRHASTAGEQLKRSAALEQVARRRGFKDWNAAAAAASSVTMSRFLFDAVDSALPTRPIRLFTVDDLSQHKVMDAISELYRWAQQLEFIATKVAVEHRRDALNLIGGQQPYVLLREHARWPDGNFRLCDRCYDPVKGPTFTLSDLEEMGAVEWEARYGSHGGSGAYSVINDDVIASRDATLLRRGARMLVGMANRVDVKYFGASSTERRGA